MRNNNSESSKTINARLLLIESSKALAMPESSETRAMPESFKTVQCPNPPKPCNARILPNRVMPESSRPKPPGRLFQASREASRLKVG